MPLLVCMPVREGGHGLLLYQCSHEDNYIEGEQQH